MLSFQLYLKHDKLGRLNLYCRDADAFSDESEQVGLLSATHAVVAMADAEERQQLAQGMAVRDVIGQARGMLRARAADTRSSLLAAARALIEGDPTWG